MVSLLDRYETALDALEVAATDAGHWSAALELMSNFVGVGTAALQSPNPLGPDRPLGVHVGYNFDVQEADELYDRFGHDDPYSASLWSDAVAGRANLVTLHRHRRPDKDRCAFINDYMGQLEFNDFAGAVLLPASETQLLPAFLSFHVHGSQKAMTEDQQRRALALLEPARAAARHSLVAAQGLDLRSQEVMEALPTAVFLVNYAGEVVYQNAAAQALLRKSPDLKLSEGRIATSHREVSRQLDSVIGSAANRWRARPRAGRMRFCGAGADTYVVSASPLQVDNPFALFAKAATGIVFVQTTQSGPLSSEAKAMLAEGFGATRAELEVLDLLAAGLTVELAAEVRGASVATIRRQLANLYRRTGEGSLPKLLALGRSLG